MGLICMHPKLLMFMWDAVREVDLGELSAAKLHVFMSFLVNSVSFSKLIFIFLMHRQWRKKTRFCMCENLFRM